MAIKVRPALFFDLGQLVNMQEHHRSETKAYELLTFNRELCTDNMALIIQDPNHLLLVAHQQDSNKLLGYIWLVRAQPHYSEQFYYAEAYTYVLPDSRNSSVLYKLINKSVVISRNSGASYLQMASFSGNDKLTEAYLKRYSTLGEVFNINL
jgi:hypothetical protein